MARNKNTIKLQSLNKSTNLTQNEKILENSKREVIKIHLESKNKFKMKIVTLLPYKENFSKIETGAVSIFVNSLNKLSKFKKDTTIYGSTNFKPLSKNYRNLVYTKRLFQSSSKRYIIEFLKKIKDKNIDILEIHNRPIYLNYLKILDAII